MSTSGILPRTVECLVSGGAELTFWHWYGYGLLQLAGNPSFGRVSSTTFSGTRNLRNPQSPEPAISRTCVLITCSITMSFLGVFQNTPLELYLSDPLDNSFFSAFHTITICSISEWHCSFKTDGFLWCSSNSYILWSLAEVYGVFIVLV